MDNHKKYLLCIAIWSVLLGLFFTSGFYNSDDMSYLTGVQTLVGERVTEPSLGSARLGVVMLPALAYWLGGSSVFLACLASVIYLPLLVYLAYYIAAQLHDKRTGLLAAFLIAHCPIYYFYAGTLLPDNPQTLAIMGTFALLLIAINHHLQSTDYNFSNALKYTFLGGIAAGIAYTAKESSLVIFVPIAIGMMIANKTFFSLRLVRYGLFFIIGFILVFIIETVTLTIISGGKFSDILGGDFVFRLGISQNAGSVVQYEDRIARQGLYPLERLSFLWGRMWPFLGFVLFPAILVSIFYPLLPANDSKQRVGRVFLWIFTSWLFLYLVFGSANLSRYLPPPIQHQRYFAPVAFGVLIMLSAFFIFICAYFEKFLGDKIYFKKVLSLIVITPLIVWSIERLIHFSPEAGSIYRAPETKAFHMALKSALQDGTDLPIVIGHYPSRRFAPLFFAAGDRVSKRVVLSPEEGRWKEGQMPEPPFIFISSNFDRYFDRTRSIIKAKQEQGLLKVRPYQQGIFRSPKGRYDEFKYYLYSLLNMPKELNINWAPEHTYFALQKIRHKR